VAQPAEQSFGADKFKLRLAVNMINHDAFLHN
jgi:hypothetical protein